MFEEIGAGEGNRTLVISLEGFCSTIELHPRHGTRTISVSKNRRCWNNSAPANAARCRSTGRYWSGGYKSNNFRRVVAIKVAARIGIGLPVIPSPQIVAKPACRRRRAPARRHNCSAPRDPGSGLERSAAAERRDQDPPYRTPFMASPRPAQDAARRGAGLSVLKTSSRHQRATSLPLANQTPPAFFMC